MRKMEGKVELEGQVPLAKNIYRAHYMLYTPTPSIQLTQQWGVKNLTARINFNFLGRHCRQVEPFAIGSRAGVYCK